MACISHLYIDTPQRIPPLILTNHTLDDKQALQTMLTELRAKPCQIQTRATGVKTRWLDFAKNNLQRSISEQNASASLLKNRYQALYDWLGITKEQVRMECFDVSHTQGVETLASCVVFDEQGPKKGAYRRFNISGITPGDDYAAMKQALTRRFKHAKEKGELPDILIIDGGKGQVAIANQVLESFNIDTVTLLGIAKGPERKAGLEHIILGDTGEMLQLSADSPALHLLQHIRDEAHRFAITSHRKKRHKSGLKSSLESIEGVGAKRRQSLLRWFGGIRELANASILEIAKVPGISEALARKIYQHFH